MKTLSYTVRHRPFSAQWFKFIRAGYLPEYRISRRTGRPYFLAWSYDHTPVPWWRLPVTSALDTDIPF